MKIRLYHALLLLTVVLFISCSKFRGAEKRGDSELLKKLPNTAIGYLIWNSQTESYKRYKGMSGGSSPLMLAKFSSSTTGELKDIAEVLQKTGVFTNTPGQTESLAEALMFITTSDGSPPAFCAYLLGSQETNLKDKLSAIQFELKNRSIELTRSKISDETADSYTLPVKGDDLPFNQLMLAANRKYFGLCSDKALLENLFASQTTQAENPIFKSENFRRATEGLPSKDSELALGYLDIQAALKSFDSYLTKMAQNNSVDFDIKKLPLVAASFSSNMEDSPSMSVAVVTTPTTDDQKRWLSTIEKSSGKLLEQLPGDSIFAGSLDGKTVVKLRDAALAEVSSTQQSALKEQLKVLDTIDRVSLSVRNAQGASPFPELLIVLKTGNSSQVFSSLSATIKGTLESTGLPIGPWSEEDLANKKGKLQYSMTPLGVGIYLASIDGYVLAASSDKVVRDAIGTLSGEAGTTLTQHLKAFPSKRITENESVVNAFTNYEEIARFVESFQGTLSMYSGGKSNMAKDELESLRREGTAAASIDFTDGVFHIVSFSKPIKAVM